MWKTGDYATLFLNTNTRKQALNVSNFKKGKNIDFLLEEENLQIRANLCDRISLTNFDVHVVTFTTRENNEIFSPEIGLVGQKLRAIRVKTPPPIRAALPLPLSLLSSSTKGGRKTVKLSPHLV